MQDVVLALLAKGPSHGYELRQRLLTGLGSLGSAFNAGQVYVTLNRLGRPGRAILSAAGLSVTVAAVVVALWMDAGIRGDTAQVSDTLGEHAVTYDKLRLVTYTFIAALVALALINAVLVAWTNALDNARNSALARALGATPRQVAAGLTVSSLLPAVVAVAAGIPIGFAVFSAAGSAAGSEANSPTPEAAGLLALLPATLVLVAILVAIPSRAASRRPVIAALRTD